MERRKLATILGILLAGLMIGCFLCYRIGGQGQSCTKQLFAMDTIMGFTAYGKNSGQAVDAAMAEVQRLDALLSTGSASSEVFRINTSGGGRLTKDTSAILEKALEIYGRTDGLFDFTIYPLMELWGFPTGDYHVPAKEELSQALPLVDASKIQYDKTSVLLGDGQKIDLGGIAKGYASARVMDIFQEYGITSGMVSLGGNVHTLHAKPDGSKWKIGIQDPDGAQGEAIAALAVEDKAVVTSGGYERYFEEGGSRYIHILDPKTGYPANQDLASVTVVSEDGMLADALSTSLYIMGLDGATAYWNAYGGDFDMALITDGRGIYVTEGISNDFQADGEVTVLRPTSGK